MSIKSIIGAACACLAVVTFNANAILISRHLDTPGDDLITFDTSTRLEWLDLTYTINRSYDDISSQFGTGQKFDGWRYAYSYEVTDLWLQFADGTPILDLHTYVHTLFAKVAPVMGDTVCYVSGCTPGDGGSMGLVEDGHGSYHTGVLLYDYSKCEDQESACTDPYWGTGGSFLSHESLS